MQNNVLIISFNLFSILATKTIECFVIGRYVKEREQFGAPLAAFQLTQQKLVRMLSDIQAMLLVGWRLCKLYDSGKMTSGHASMGKVDTS